MKILILLIGCFGVVAENLAIKTKEKVLIFRREKMKNMLIMQDIQDQMTKFRQRMEKLQQKFMQSIQAKGLELEKMRNDGKDVSNITSSLSQKAMQFRAKMEEAERQAQKQIAQASVKLQNMLDKVLKDVAKNKAVHNADSYAYLPESYAQDITGEYVSRVNKIQQNVDLNLNEIELPEVDL